MAAVSTLLRSSCALRSTCYTVVGLLCIDLTYDLGVVSWLNHLVELFFDGEVLLVPGLTELLLKQLLT